MVHIKKEKGDLAVYKTMSDLAQKGYYVFTTVTEHLPFDLIACRDGVCYRIQAKYSSDGFIDDKCSWSDKHGAHTRKYEKQDFDYYSLYLPSKDVVVYPSISFGGKTIAFEIPASPTPFYWYEDFMEFTQQKEKRTFFEFGVYLTRDAGNRNCPTENISNRKVIRPSKEELQKLVWEIPTSKLAIHFGVSDKAIGKWCKSYGITKPARGYWVSKKSVDNETASNHDVECRL
jgi:hypothetical protein